MGTILFRNDVFKNHSLHLYPLKKRHGHHGKHLLGFDWLKLLKSSPLKLQVQMIFNLIQMMYVMSSTKIPYFNLVPDEKHVLKRRRLSLVVIFYVTVF
jgi:hypothetical protein